MTRRISPDHERQSAIDLITVLLQNRVERLNAKSATQSHNRHYKRVISALLWKHSEAWGKYDGCPYWSAKALEARKLFGRVQTRKSIAHEKALRHEHVYPRKQLIEKLVNIDNPTIEIIGEVINKLNIGVVVTVEEHSLLPILGVEHDPWERYKLTGIEVINTFKIQNISDVEHDTSDKIEVRRKRQQPEVVDKKSDYQNIKTYQYSINGQVFRKYAKGRMMLDIIGVLLAKGIEPDAIRNAIPWLKNRLIRVYNGYFHSQDVYSFISQDDVENKGWVRRFFLNESEIVHCNGKTFAITNQWGKRTLLALENLMRCFPDQNIKLHD